MKPIIEPRDFHAGSSPPVITRNLSLVSKKNGVALTIFGTAVDSAVVAVAAGDSVEVAATEAVVVAAAVAAC